jgi:hypothetical protein
MKVSAELGDAEGFDAPARGSGAANSNDKKQIGGKRYSDVSRMQARPWPIFRRRPAGYGSGREYHVAPLRVSCAMETEGTRSRAEREGEEIERYNQNKTLGFR